MQHWALWLVALTVVFALALAASALSLLRVRRSLADARAQLGAREDHGRILRSLLDASLLAVILCAETGRIVYDNEPARQLFFEGKPAEGQNFLRLAANGPAGLQTALLGGNDEILGLTVEGQRETYHFARRTFDFAGAPHTLLVVRPMTREIAKHDLETLRMVVRIMSHEVNNSLAPVSSLVHSARAILASRERVERLERVFDTIEERAKHLSKFIAGYATLSRLPKPAPQEVEWRQLLAKLAPLFPQAVLSAPDGVRGYFDPGQLEQALINLLKNATESGGAPSDVRLEVKPLPSAAAELCVLDRGAGFSQEAIESALLPFFTTKPGGSGLGLALVREIVQAHDGRLTLSSRDGGGAVITVQLPGLQPEVDATSRARLTLTRS